MRNQQALDEIAIFREFAKIYPYAIQIDSIQKRREPEPDIFCKLLNGSSAYFELVELIDNSVARSFYGGSFQGGFFTDDFYLKSIQAKFKKKYSADCELLVYIDLQPLIAVKSWLPLVQNFIKGDIENSPFKRVWVYSIAQGKIMLVYPDCVKE